MAIKRTVDQKRLQSIYRQLYGKSTTKESTTSIKAQQSFKVPETTTHVAHAGVETRTNYLKSDLLKIFAFSTAAILIQVSLFFATKNHLISLRF